MKKILIHSMWLLLLVPGVAIAQSSPGYSPNFSGLQSPAAYSPSGNWQPVNLQNSAFGALNTGFQPAGSNISQQNIQPFCQNGICSYTPLEPFNWYEAKAGSYGSLAQYLNAAFRVILTLGAMLAVVMLVFAGISYMISESGIKTSVAKDRLKAALTGLALLIGAWLIVAAVNPNLLSLNTLMSALPAKAPPAGTNTNSVANTAQTQTVAQQNETTQECERKGQKAGRTSDGSIVCLNK